MESGRGRCPEVTERVTEEGRVSKEQSRRGREIFAGFIGTVGHYQLSGADRISRAAREYFSLSGWT